MPSSAAVSYTHLPNVPQKEYAISSAPQLAGLAQLVNQGNSLEGTTIRLHSDLDLAGHNWIPIGNQLEAEEGKKAAVFSGTFEGNGHIISNLTIGCLLYTSRCV